MVVASTECILLALGFLLLVSIVRNGAVVVAV